MSQQLLYAYLENSETLYAYKDAPLITGIP